MVVENDGGEKECIMVVMVREKSDNGEKQWKMVKEKLVTVVENGDCGRW